MRRWEGDAFPIFVFTIDPPPQDPALLYIMVMNI